MEETFKETIFEKMKVGVN